MAINLRDQILKSQLNYYQGLICKHQQNVEIYLNQPVGIGEHSDVLGTIEKELEKCASMNLRLVLLALGQFWIHNQKEMSTRK